MNPRYRDPDWLHQRSHHDALTQREIAEACDVSSRTIRNWMNRHDIETRTVEGEDHDSTGKNAGTTSNERYRKHCRDGSFPGKPGRRFRLQIGGVRFLTKRVIDSQEH